MRSSKHVSLQIYVDRFKLEKQIFPRKSLIMKSESFFSKGPMRSQENDGLIRKAYMGAPFRANQTYLSLSFLSKLITLSSNIPYRS